MALKLIGKDERIVYRGAGFEIFYRRMPSNVRARILEKHTKRGGDVDFTRATIEMLEYSIIGWSGVEDEVGEPTPYSIELIPRIPDAEQAKLVELIGANVEAEDVEAKNSPTISGSKPTTKA
jgi:hypothetical protein